MKSNKNFQLIAYLPGNYTWYIKGIFTDRRYFNLPDNTWTENRHRTINKILFRIGRVEAL